MLQDILVTICSFFIIAFLCAKRKGQTAFLRIFTFFTARSYAKKALCLCDRKLFFGKNAVTAPF